MAFIISLILFLVSFFLVYQTPDMEKFSIYECGFNPYGDARIKFEIKYYLVAIIFIIFDLELTFLIPWILAINNINYIGIVCMLIFMYILTLGFIYEWIKGALDW